MDGTSFFSTEALTAVANGGVKSRRRIIHMHPHEFLRMAATLERPTPEKKETVARVLASGSPFNDLPFLGFVHDGVGQAKVVSHEGRHRAMALADRGVTKMPVVMESQSGGAGEGIRWESQNSPYDRIRGQWPKTLHGETEHSMSFPVSDLRSPRPEKLARGSLIQRALQLGKISRPLPEWVPREEEGPQSNTTGYLPVESSWIAGLKYTQDRGVEMAVKKGGKSYHYPGLNLASFRRWAQARSPGGWFNRNIRPLQNSRWTGPVHPLFTGSIDGPPAVSPMSSMDHHEALDLVRRTISPHATMSHLSAMIGWVPGAQTSFRTAEASGIPYLRSDVMTPGGYYATSRSIVPKGVYGGHEHNIENDLMLVKGKSPFAGASGPVLLRQIRAAYELGIPRVAFHAVYQPNPNYGQAFSGGLHWPMMGANGYIPEDWLARVPPHVIKSADEASQGRFSAGPPEGKTFEEFFRSPLAKQYYANDPVTHQGFIDTTPGSYSRKAIERHVTEKATAHGFGPPIPDEQMPKTPLHFNMQAARHPMTDHLLATGSLHPDWFDHYFEN